MDDPRNIPDSVECPECRTKIALGLLSCPSCRHLVHAAELKNLAGLAEESERKDDPGAALALWRQVLELLPAGSRQHDIVLEKVAAISRLVDAGHAAGSAGNTPEPQKPGTRRRGWKKGWAGFGTVGLVLWKFKVIIGFLLTKGKLLLLGLTKAGTLLSMALSFGLYWSLWGWKFALGLMASIYVHEMGHVAALKRFGIPASAPSFIPGLGAFVRMKQYPATPIEDSRIGLAGPMWGLGAALAAYAIYLMTGWANWAAVARIGAWINLFNLLPTLPLDGGRGFQAMSRHQRWIAAAAIGIALFLTSEGLLALLLIVAVLRALGKGYSDRPDQTALVHYILLLAVFSAMCLIQVPIPAE